MRKRSHRSGPNYSQEERAERGMHVVVAIAMTTDERDELTAYAKRVRKSRSRAAADLIADGIKRDSG